MFEVLAQAVEDVEIPADSAALVEVWGSIDRLQAKATMAVGGPTEPDNLVLFCRRHHTMVHKRGWRIKLLPDATVEVTSPDGRVETTRPPPRC